MNLTDSIATLDNDNLMRVIRRERLRVAAMRAGIYSGEDNPAFGKILETAEEEAHSRKINLLD